MTEKVAEQRGAEEVCKTSPTGSIPAVTSIYDEARNIYYSMKGHRVKYPFGGISFLHLIRRVPRQLCNRDKVIFSGGFIQSGMLAYHRHLQTVNHWISDYLRAPSKYYLIAQAHSILLRAGQLYAAHEVLQQRFIQLSKDHAKLKRSKQSKDI